MKRIILIAVLALFACTQKPLPIVKEQPPRPEERYAIAVEYVAVPAASIYALPSPGAAVTGSYGMTEAVSILGKKGDWVEVRTFGGTGWMRQADLVAGDVAAKMDTKTPRFYLPPKEVPFGGNGIISLHAKVNTDGDVIEVKTLSNTTGSARIAEANAAALKEAKFYPVIEDRARKIFTYEHRVYY